MALPLKFRPPLAAALTALLLASCGSEPAPQITVEDAWARAAAPGRASAAAYFTIANTGGGDRLVAVSTPVGTASIHSTSMDGGVMRMRPLDFLDVPAGGTVRLEPGGTHVMLTGLREPLTAGSSLPLTLRFERSGERRLSLEVRGARR